VCLTLYASEKVALPSATGLKSHSTRCPTITALLGEGGMGQVSPRPRHEVGSRCRDQDPAGSLRARHAAKPRSRKAANSSRDERPLVTADGAGVRFVMHHLFLIARKHSEATLAKLAGDV
jgi:hypothetical protein